MQISGLKGLMASNIIWSVSTIAISQIHEEVQGYAGYGCCQCFLTALRPWNRDQVKMVSGDHRQKKRSTFQHYDCQRRYQSPCFEPDTLRILKALNKMYSILGNIERIGDHAMNLAGGLCPDDPEKT